MTITYPSGTVLEAIALAHDQHEIRAISPGSGDVLAFTFIHRTWISEEFEPVNIEFDWQRPVATRVPTENDCICSKELAAYLIGTLLSGNERVEADTDTIFVFSPQGVRVTSRTDLQLRVTRGCATRSGDQAAGRRAFPAVLESTAG